MQGLLILAKDWGWAACTLVALWLLSGCSDCGRPARVDKSLVIAGDAAAEEPQDQVVASMDPEAEAGQGKSLGKDKDQAAEFEARCNSIAETVLLHHHLEGWPYQMGVPVPTHGEERRHWAEAARNNAKYRRGACVPFCVR